MASVVFPPGASDFERAQLVALELIRRQVADMPLAIASNLSKYGGGGGGGAPGGAASGGGGAPPGGGGGEPDEFRNRLKELVKSVRDADDRFRKWWKGIAANPGTALTNAAVGMAGTITKSAVGAFAMVGNMLQAKFSQVLGPAAVFGQVLNTSTAGFNVLSKAISVAAAALGPVLLPITFALTVAIIEWADKIHDELMPALDDWYQFVLSNMLPALRSFGNAVFDVVSALVDAGVAVRDGMRGARDWFRDTAGDIAVGFAAFGEWAGLVPEGTTDATAEDEMRRRKEKEAAAKPPAAPGGAPAKPFDAIMGAAMGVTRGAAKDKSGGMSGAMRDVLREFRLSLGPKASISSLSSVNSSATLAALNQSPFEARMLKWAVEALDKLERTARAVEKPAPVFPTA